MATKKVTAVDEAQVSNDGEFQVMKEKPFCAKIRIQGTKDILFHAWNTEDVEAKAEAKKGSEQKKTDNLEAYVYRDDKGFICIPGRYIVRSIVEAGRNFNDPRSSKPKQAKELMKKAIICDEMLSPVLVNDKPVTTWDYEDKQRVCIMKSAVTRTRPAIRKGWEVEFSIISLMPDIVTPSFLRNLVDNAGTFEGLGDYRPTYGRFKVVSWEILHNISSDVM